MVKKVKLVRIAQGYPTYKFAVLVGVHLNWWREIEMGTREPSVAHFGAVSSAAESLPSKQVIAGSNPITRSTLVFSLLTPPFSSS